MNLAISNIAWQPHEEAAVRSGMAERGLAGVEVAPTKVWGEPLSASARAVARYRASWEDAGIRIVALQSLLFGHPELQVFGTPVRRAETLAYLSGMIRLAGELGAGVLVLGSPRNRMTTGREPHEVEVIAREFFRRLGEEAYAHDVCFCIEPNPVAYGCDFITSAAEGLEWVERIAHPGLGLHLDAACLTMAGDPAPESIRAAQGVLRHFHVSEPQLGELGVGGVDHALMARSLEEAGFGRWRSIEMRAAEQGPGIERVLRALDFARQAYAPS